MRICAFKNCHNGEYKLYKFRRENPGKPDPFVLYQFPQDNPQQCHRWCLQINRQNKSGKLWMPKKHSRVCSIHFENGEPSEQQPDPTLHLGYEPSKTTDTRRTKNSGFVAKFRSENDSQENQTENVMDLVDTAQEEQQPSYENQLPVQNLTEITVPSLTLETDDAHKNTENKIKSLQQKASKLKCNRLKRKAVKKLKVFKTFTTTDEKTKFYTGIPTCSLYFSLAR